MYTIKHWVAGVILCCLFNLCLVQSSKAQGCEVCSGGTFVYDTITIVLPGYPDCPLQLDYTKRVCPNGTTEIQVIGFYMPNSSNSDCATLLASIENPDGSPNWAGVDAVYLAASQLLPQILLMRDYNAAVPMDKWMFECPQGQRTYGSRYATCRRWVEIQPFGNPHRAYVKLESCNEEACCIEIREICFNKATGQLEVQITSIPSPANQCIDIGPPTDPFAVSWSKCMMWECPE